MKIVKILSESITEQTSENNSLAFNLEEKEEKAFHLTRNLKNVDIEKCAEHLFLERSTRNPPSTCPTLKNTEIEVFLNLLETINAIQINPFLIRGLIKNTKIAQIHISQQENVWNDLQSDIDLLLQNKNSKILIQNIFEYLAHLLQGPKGEIYRKNLYHIFTHSQTTRTRIKNVINFLSPLFKDWSHFSVDKNLYQFEPMPSQYQCENYNKTNLGGNPCPNQQDTLKFIKKGIETMTRKSTPNRPTLLHQYLKTFSVDGRPPSKYHLTLTEVSNFLYNTTDLTRKENTLPITYIDQRFQKHYEETTILQRIETVLREGRFDDNYLIIYHVNNIVNNDDFSHIIRKNELILKLCTKLRFVGKQ